MDKNWIIIIALLLVIIALLAGLVFMMSNNGNAESKLTISCNSTVEIGDSIEFKLTDANGNPISNENISITITNAENTDSYYSVATDENGIGVLKLDKSPGKYDVNAIFNGNGKYAKSSDSKTITIEEEASASEPVSSETVPEDHIVGKPIFIWWSSDPDRGGFGGIRWSRLFRFVDNIK